MSKNGNLANDGKLTQNQNNAMSDDPRDGGRHTSHIDNDDGGPAPLRPEPQGEDQLRAFGERGTRQD